jgi:hypothetical protein
MKPKRDRRSLNVGPCSEETELSEARTLPGPQSQAVALADAAPTTAALQLQPPCAAAPVSTECDAAGSAMAISRNLTPSPGRFGAKQHLDSVLAQ